MLRPHRYGKFNHMSEHNQHAEENKYDKHALIYKGAVIGENTFVGPFSFIDSKVSVGKECSISIAAQIYSHDTSFYHATKGEIQKTERETVIEDYCVIGANAVILPGVRVGHNSIVGAGSVVTKNVEPCTIVAGNPAKKIGEVEKC
jgi:2,3,4,5-tetrahydropyridine-2-carboxylate N-succinyltransferase/tetrahydrodipicolinate N-acetyltransferase